MDVGVDSTFSTSLREPADTTPEQNLRRRLQSAIREETRLFRSKSMLNSSPLCARCSDG